MPRSRSLKNKDPIPIDEAERARAKAEEPRIVSTGPTTTPDVFTDEWIRETTHFTADFEKYLDILWKVNPEFHQILENATDVESAREAMYTYLEKCERKVFEIENDLHIMEKSTIRECVRVLRSIFGPINESRNDCYPLIYLWKLAQGRVEEMKQTISTGFLFEFIHLAKGITGSSYIYKEAEKLPRKTEEFYELRGREAGIYRSDQMDDLAAYINKYFKKYPSGLEEDVAVWRKRNKRRVLEYFDAEPEDWRDYQWHLKHVIKDAGTLKELIEITKEQEQSIELAVKHKIPFGITPYYLSLMDRKVALGYDYSVRAQVIPPLHYVKEVIKHKEDRHQTLDFMGEHDTSPQDLVTRRYPMIAILKPYNTCSQICVYCQRNWELDTVLDRHAYMGKRATDAALDWFAEHPAVSDILITGGDPAIMKDEQLEHIFERIARMPHVKRIRFGTRTPVVLPMRINSGFLKLLKRFHKPGRRELCVVTHFEHSYEISEDTLEAVQKIRKLGISIYNQQVFTLNNCRRFETAKLRRDLRVIGVDPYYVFNMKGKDETRDYHVPIARLMQERKEEARLLPGIDRTDEPVFNVPRLGKNHLMRWQDHRLVMIRPDGSRVYEFHPWEKNIQEASTYLYQDVPIFEFLEEMERRGDDKQEYRTIWYYF